MTINVLMRDQVKLAFEKGTMDRVELPAPDLPKHVPSALLVENVVDAEEEMWLELEKKAKAQIEEAKPVANEGESNS